MAYDADPTIWPSGRRYIYSKGTSTTSLRPHIEKYHLEEYKRLANERGWKIMLPGLVSQARSEAAASVPAADERRDDFDEQTFHEYLLNFIVADDQVCLSFLCLPSHLNYSIFSVLEGRWMSWIQGFTTSLTSWLKGDNDSTPYQATRAYCWSMAALFYQCPEEGSWGTPHLSLTIMLTNTKSSKPLVGSHSLPTSGPVKLVDPILQSLLTG